MSEKFCGNCDFYSNGLCVANRWDVSEESPICSIFRKTYPGTVFQKITASPEVLAEKFIYVQYTHYGTKYYMSTIVDGEWYNKEEAFAATVAKLNFFQ